MIGALLDWIEEPHDEAKGLSRAVLVILVAAIVLSTGIIVLGWHFVLVLLALSIYALFKWVRWTLRP